MAKKDKAPAETPAEETAQAAPPPADAAPPADQQDAAPGDAAPPPADAEAPASGKIRVRALVPIASQVGTYQPDDEFEATERELQRMLSRGYVERV